VTPITNAILPGQAGNFVAGSAVQQQVQPATTPASLLLNSRIYGNAVIDGRKEIAIDAVPVAP
jgi:hypothetical protein